MKMLQKYERAVDIIEKYLNENDETKSHKRKKQNTKRSVDRCYNELKHHFQGRQRKEEI